MGLLYNDIVATGVDPSADDAMLQLKSTRLVLTMMEQVEELVLANDVDGAYSFMFHTSNEVTLGDKITTFTKLFNKINVEGVSVSTVDALLQVQTTIVVIEILRITESQSGSDLASFLESGNWEAASNLIQNPASFSEALNVLPLAASSEIKA